MPRTRTGLNAYSVKFSPFQPGRVAVASAQNFGIIGNGRQQVYQIEPNGAFRELAAFDTLDGLYDCAWSEAQETLLLAASGDGSVKLYDVAAPPMANPLRQFKEHRHECCSVSANLHNRELFLSSSWDDTVKLWNLGQPQSLRTFTGHTYCVYHVAWSPIHSDVFLSASGDTTVRVWDLRQPMPTLNLAAHGYEVLTVDWCKYNECLVATGSVDKTIKVWDLRRPHQEVLLLQAHNYAVKRVMWSPHAEHLLASCSYDMTVKLWDTASAGLPLVRSWDHHSEFAVGLDWSVLEAGVLASCGWDEQVAVWHTDGAP